MFIEKEVFGLHRYTRILEKKKNYFFHCMHHKPCTIYIYYFFYSNVDTNQIKANRKYMRYTAGHC